MGLFVINTQVQPAQTIYIKARMTGATSVLMAEAAAMTLAAIITHCLNLQPIIFLSDNQQLVHFLNAPNQTNLPEWRIKHFTQMFTKFTGQRHARILKIQRTQNQTADVLARQPFLESQPTSFNMAGTCTNIAHVT
jgi:fatty acid-binding protein DegV